MPVGFRLWSSAAALAGLQLMAVELAARAGWSLTRAWGLIFLGLLSLVIGVRLLGLDRAGRARRRLLGRSLDDLDALDGPAFEEWIAAVLGEAGWCVVRTPHGSDFGVDLIASKDGMRIGIEAKRRSGRISNAVIRSVVAGCQYHDCAVAAVVTQSTFTAQARRQAAASNLPVMLVGRNDLTRLCALMASGPFLREGNGG